MTEFPKKLNHHDIEHKWREAWFNDQLYNCNLTLPRKDIFVIDTPPPTVSGDLHMGHIFSYTQTDIIARFMRMSGKSVFYPIGFDDNGLPTERLTEKVKKIKATDIPRKDFTALCKEVVIETEERFRNLFKSIALSVDWSQEYQTISDQSKKISQLSFIDLYNKNQIYRQPEAVIWDPVDQTALAQADLEEREIDSLMNYIAFTCYDGSKFEIATTRPELLPACVAVFCHPDDPRYQKYIGKYAITPLFKAKVPILAEDTVSMDKGTGMVMCCTFGDSNDVIWWKKHRLDTKIIIDKRGCLSKTLSAIDGAEYLTRLKGLKVKNARQEIITILTENGLLIRQEPIKQIIKCAERSKSAIEILINPQWFVKILDKKDQLKNKADQLSWYPDYMRERLKIWVDGLNWDWCISRQRFFGVPFPVWYSKRKGEEGKIILPNPSVLPVDPLVDLPDGYTRKEVESDKDVMDTWATSSLTPQLSSHAVTKDFSIDYVRHKKLYPADLRPQAHEIIRTWTFYTMVKSFMHEDSIPWHNVMVSGWCLAADKTKMSKSKGNIIKPDKLIFEKGADVVRYWTATAKLGSDIFYSEEMFDIGKKLTNKLWNASKFISSNFKLIKFNTKSLADDIEQQIIYEHIDLWILAKLKTLIIKSTEEFINYEYSHAKQLIERFFWKDLCDNYLEIVKIRIYNDNGQNAKGQLSAIHTLYYTLDVLLKLFAPILPFITEEIHNLVYQRYSIHQRGTWPKIEDFVNVSTNTDEGDYLIDIIDYVRKFKAKQQLSVKAEIAELYIAKANISPNIISNLFTDLANVTNTKNILISDNDNNFTITEGNNFKIKIVMP